MFIRYNNTSKWWEYDTSGPQNGTGPWVKLQIDYSQIINVPPGYVLPANVAFKDINNNFSVNQSLPDFSGVISNNGVFRLSALTAPTDLKEWRFVNYTDGPIRLEALNDAQSSVLASFLFYRSGQLTIGGPLYVGGNITEQNRSAPMGYPINIAYSNTAFNTYPAGSWVVPSANVLVNKYTLIGKTLIYQLFISDSTVSAGISHLILSFANVPVGGGQYSSGHARFGAEIASTYSVPGDPSIYINRNNSAAWPASTGNLFLTTIYFIP